MSYKNTKENKQSESYPRVFSENIDYLKRERRKKKRSLSTKKRNERRRKITEARKKHIKNLSDNKMITGASSVTIPETMAGHISAPVPLSFFRVANHYFI